MIYQTIAAVMVLVPLSNSLSTTNCTLLITSLLLRSSCTTVSTYQSFLSFSSFLYKSSANTLGLFLILLSFWKRTIQLTRQYLAIYFMDSYCIQQRWSASTNSLRLSLLPALLLRLPGGVSGIIFVPLSGISYYPVK